MGLHRPLDGQDPVEQISIPLHAAFGDDAGGLSGDEGFFLQQTNILSDRVLAHAYRFADGLVAGPAPVGLSVFSEEQVAIHRQLSGAQVQGEDLIGQRKIVFSGISLRKICIRDHVPPAYAFAVLLWLFFVFSGAEFSLGPPRCFFIILILSIFDLWEIDKGDRHLELEPPMPNIVCI